MQVTLAEVYDILQMLDPTMLDCHVFREKLDQSSAEIARIHNHVKKFQKQETKNRLELGISQSVLFFIGSGLNESLDDIKWSLKKQLQSHT